MKEKWNKIIGYFNDPLEVLLIITVLGISLYFHIESYTFSGDSKVFPQLTSGLTIILTLIYLIKLFLQVKGEYEEGGEEILDESMKRVLITGGSYIGFVIVSYLFGFLISSVILMISYPLLLAYKKIVHIITGLIVVVSTIIIFQYVLNIPLMSGKLLELNIF